MLNFRFRDKTNAWPGFVDLFSNLVIILIFLLIVFVFLWTTTSVFNKNTGARKIAALEALRQQQAEQIVQMTADKEHVDQLLLAARNALQSQENQIMNKQIQQQNLANAYEEKIIELTDEREQLYAEIERLSEMLNVSADDAQVDIATIQSEYAASEQELLAQVNELKSTVAKLQNALDVADQASKQQDIEYIEMSNRLNKALADKVAELNSLGQYQSEFYKQIKLALGNTDGIKQDGDRFIISSDILFSSGSYKISADGKKQLKILANIIKNLERKIPNDVDWIIRVDGHTDDRPVIYGTHGYKNNLELSLLRATAVVNELVNDGVQRRRLIPSGFGDMYPVAFGNGPKTLQKNRRIELQLTNK